jgi:hypothetical protein
MSATVQIQKIQFNPEYESFSTHEQKLPAFD